jgi:hypothetical protein
VEGSGKGFEMPSQVGNNVGDQELNRLTRYFDMHNMAPTLADQPPQRKHKHAFYPTLALTGAYPYAL